MGFVYILCAIGALIQGVFIIVEHKEKYVLAVILKGTASLFFVTVGAMMIAKGSNDKLVLVGLVLGLIGDVLLNLRFVFTKIGSKVFLAGVASFLIGHILYVVAIVKETTPVLVCAISALVVAAIILAIIFKVLDVKLSYKIFGILYIGAVCLMTSFAIGNYIVVETTKNLLYAIGAFSFLISDVVLIFNSFGKAPKFSLRITNLTLYYIGQILIALSMFGWEVIQ